MEVSYRCICCHHRFGVAIPDREGAIPAASYPRMRCPACGAASALEYYLEHANDEHGHFLWEAFYRRWSNCPNASACSLHDQYGPECEAGQVMQKCFVALHCEFAIASSFLRDLAGKKRGRRGKTPAPGK